MITRQFVFDTETSDLPPDGRVCEVALLELNDDAEWIVKAESLIDPQAPFLRPRQVYITLFTRTSKTPRR